MILSRLANVTIMVWSGCGEQYARKVVAYLGLDSYVDRYADKRYIPIPGCPGGNAAGADCIDPLRHRHFASDLRPDIAIDDMTAFNVPTVNLIVGHDPTNPVLARRIDDARQLTQPDADVSWLADIRAILYSVIFQPELETRIDSVLAEIMSGDTQQYRRPLTVALAYPTTTPVTVDSRWHSGRQSAPAL